MARINGTGRIDRKLWALQGIELLQTMGGDNAAPNVLAKCADMIGTLTHSAYVQENANHTAYVVARNNEDAIVCCHGTDLEAQMVPEFTGYINPQVATDGLREQNPYSTWARAGGKEVFATARDAGILNARQFWLFGHSAGYGQVGEFWREFLDLNPFTQAYAWYTSFGGNAWSNASVRDYMSGKTREFRWMNAEDPVPLFPWCMADMTGGVYYLNPPTWRTVRNFVHNVNGLNLSRVGELTERQLPSNAEADPTISVIAWLRAMRTGINNEHSTTEYARRINLMPPDVDAPPRAHSTDQVDTAAQPPLSLPVPGTASETAAQLRTLTAAAEARAASAPPVVPTVLPGDHYQGKKIGDRWFIVKGPIIVTRADGKRHAKDTARKLNRITRDTTSIDDGKLLAQVAYLNS